MITPLFLLSSSKFVVPTTRVVSATRVKKVPADVTRDALKWDTRTMPYKRILTLFHLCFEDAECLTSFQPF